MAKLRASRVWIAVGIVAVLVVSGAVAAVAANSRRSSAAPVVTTLSQIKAGKFRTASDKKGTGGVVVTVTGLRVNSIRVQHDGDWHVSVSDGKLSAFITEIIPRDQARVGRPPVGAKITETGTPFCDRATQTQPWHGKTCWEIHPVTSWTKG
jgi:hypothetical protein